MKLPSALDLYEKPRNFLNRYGISIRDKIADKVAIGVIYLAWMGNAPFDVGTNNQLFGLLTNGEGGSKAAINGIKFIVIPTIHYYLSNPRNLF